MNATEKLQQELSEAGVKATIRIQKSPFDGDQVMINPAATATFAEVTMAICGYLGHPEGLPGRKMQRLLDERYAALKAELGA